MSSPSSSGEAESSRNAQRRQQQWQGQILTHPPHGDHLKGQSFNAIKEYIVGHRPAPSSSGSPDHLQQHISTVHSETRDQLAAEAWATRDQLAAEAWATRKKRKITRARNACLPCRTRKCRCAGQPPDACDSCIKDDLKCSWPTEDGRSAEARQSRSHRKRKATSERPIETMPAELNVDLDLWSGLLGHDWLSDLGGASTAIYSQSSDLDLFSSTAYNSFNPTESHSSSTSFNHTSTSSIPPFDLGILSPDWLSVFDPAQVVMALSSRLPVVEETVTENEPLAPPTQGASAMRLATDPVSVPSNMAGQDKVVKLTWWRPHGQTAIVPGLQRIILKVRVQAPGSTSQATTPFSPGFKLVDEMIGPDRMPHPGIMKHLLQVFIDHFGCQFPCLDKQSLEASIDGRTGSSFLFVCIAAVAARFSNHPLIALKELKPFEYGNNFYKVAKDMLGSMLSVPSRETVIGLVLLAHMGLAIEAEEWMFTGMAARMSIDLGLQLDPPEEAQISATDRRLNRLVFWSILLLDFALAFGTGRQPTFRVEEITQLLPTEEDLSSSPSTGIQNPFPYAARQMLAYGQLITVLNSGRQKPEETEKAVIMVRSRAIQVYNTLPQDLHWNVTNLQKHTAANQAQMYLHLHLWMHTIIASGYLTNTDYLRRGTARTAARSGTNSGHVTPNAIAASNLWRNSARTIGDVLVLSDILNPNAYLSLPFCNQAFFVAGCCYVKEIEQERTSQSSVSGIGAVDRSQPAVETGSSHCPSTKEKDAKKPSDLFRSLLTSVATNNITTVQQGLMKQTSYWGGIAWVAEALAQRVAGIGASDIDLAAITEKLSSSVYVADAGVLSSSTVDRHQDVRPFVPDSSQRDPGGREASFLSKADLHQSDIEFLTADWETSTGPILSGSELEH